MKIGMSGRQRHLPELGFEEQLGPLEAVTAISDQPGVARVNRDDLIQIRDKSSFMASDHLVRAGAERDLRPRGKIDAMNPRNEPFRIAA